MKRIFQLLLFVPLIGIAQDKGIRFQHGLNWKETREKAKAENKYIFIDCYATWCGPCKTMSQKVFPLEQVGTYMNDKFISIKVQFDTTGNDNDTVKGWYADAHQFMQEYKIGLFPTYLFFAPDGHIVHKAAGAFPNPKTFLDKVADALDPDKQFYTLLKQYDEGKRDTTMVRRLALSAFEFNDQDMAARFGREYIQGMKNVYTK